MKEVIVLFLGLLLFCACNRPPTARQDPAHVASKPGVSEISAKEAKPSVEAAYAQFIDVRTKEEFAEGHAARTRNIPLDELAGKLDLLEKNEPVYLICRSGSRSKKAAELLADNGFKQAITIAGGTEAWQAAGFPMVK